MAQSEPTGETRICPGCKESRDISWYRRLRNGKPGGRCTLCRRKYQETYRARNREAINERARNKKYTDPVGYAKYRERNKKASRAWRERNKEKIKEYNRQKWIKIKSDPVLHAIYSENSRINHVLLEEKRGRKVTRFNKNVISLPTHEKLVPAAPFVPFVNGNLLEIAECAGIDEKLLRALKAGEKTYLYLSTADKLATALNLPLAAYVP